jgi:membrane protease YdiL (CAAX protease family)
MNSPLPPPIPGTAVVSVPRHVPPPPPSVRITSTLPLVAAAGAVLVLTISLLGSKLLLDAVVGFGWPVAVYVTLLASVGYGPSLWWCRFASRRWGTGRLSADIGLTPRLSDLGWGPVVWLGAIVAQVAIGAVVIALDVPIVRNTEGIEELSADRTYVVSIVISAVLAAPLVEEMVFRGVVMRGLASRLRIGAVVVVQGLLFGVAHVDPVRGVGNIGLVLVLSGVGIAFGVAVALLGRIGPSIVAHAIFNAVVLVILLSGLADRLDEASPERVEEIGVVDQTDGAEPSSDRDAYGSRTTLALVEPDDRAERRAVEHLDIVQHCQRL